MFFASFHSIVAVLEAKPPSCSFNSIFAGLFRNERWTCESRPSRRREKEGRSWRNGFRKRRAGGRSSSSVRWNCAKNSGHRWGKFKYRPPSENFVLWAISCWLNLQSESRPVHKERLFCASSPARWPGTCQCERTTLTCGLTLSRRATAQTRATTCPSLRRPAVATWSKWEERSRPGRNGGSFLTATDARSPTMQVNCTERWDGQRWICLCTFFYYCFVAYLLKIELFYAFKPPPLHLCR